MSDPARMDASGQRRLTVVILLLAAVGIVALILFLPGDPDTPEAELATTARL